MVLILGLRQRPTTKDQRPTTFNLGAPPSRVLRAKVGFHTVSNMSFCRRPTTNDRFPPNTTARDFSRAWSCKLENQSADLRVSGKISGDFRPPVPHLRAFYALRWDSTAASSVSFSEGFH